MVNRQSGVREQINIKIALALCHISSITEHIILVYGLFILWLQCITQWDDVSPLQPPQHYSSRIPSHVECPRGTVIRATNTRLKQHHALLGSQMSMQPTAELPRLLSTSYSLSTIVKRLTNGVHNSSNAHGNYALRLQHDKRFETTELIKESTKAYR